MCGLLTEPLLSSEEEVEHGHPDADPIGDLFDDGRAFGVVRHFGGDLHPRFIGPGCMTIALSPSIAMRRASRPYRREYSRADGKNPPAMRSRWTRSIITHIAVGENGVEFEDACHRPVLHAARHESGRGRPEVTRAPGVVSSATLDRATRECNTSPTMATRRPSDHPWRPGAGAEW